MDRIKGYLFLTSIFVIWTGSAFLRIDIPFTEISIWGWHLYLIATLLRFSRVSKLERWGKSFWMWTDQGVNVFHGGNEDVTVSSKVGYLEEKGSKTAAIMAIVINLLWYIGTGKKNHCISAIERDEEHYSWKR